MRKNKRIDASFKRMIRMAKKIKADYKNSISGGSPPTNGLRYKNS